MNSTGEGQNTKLTQNRKVSVKKVSNGTFEYNQDVKNASREELEREIARLRETVSSMSKGRAVDEVSGIANRATFLEQANAEFNRTRRYDHSLTLCVTDVIGLNRILSQHGADGGNQVMMAVAQMCVSSSRYGVDILGRISDNQIAIMLPETQMTGGLAFMSRMRKIVSENPIYLNSGEHIKPGLKVSVDSLSPEDRNFNDLFVRTWRRTSKGQEALGFAA